MSSAASAIFVWFGLIVLLAITAGTSMLDLGGANVAINLAIAAAKTLLILLFFMHLWRGGALTRLAAGGTALWLGMLFVLTLLDFATR
jgi:cytochrome c oxidase subunit 4